MTPLWIQDRHVVSAGEAAYDAVVKCFKPSGVEILNNTVPSAGRPELWALYGFMVSVTNTSGVYKQGVQVVLGALMPPNVDYSVLDVRIQSNGDFARAWFPFGLPTNYGICWVVRANGLIATDVVYTRAWYSGLGEPS